MKRIIEITDPMEAGQETVALFPGPLAPVNFPSDREPAWVARERARAEAIRATRPVLVSPASLCDECRGKVLR